MNGSLRRSAAAVLLSGCLTAFAGVQGAYAAPITSVEYVETALGGGAFQYDYTVKNLSDPLDLGVDIYDLTLFFDPSLSFVSGTTPVDWDVIGGNGFINTFSLAPGAAPAGADIGPGQQLTGFRFVLDGKIGSSGFEVLFGNPQDPSNPTAVEGVTTAAGTGPTPVPEPATMLLIGSGIGSLLLARSREASKARTRAARKTPDS
jgi:hypothetical protein